MKTDRTISLKEKVFASMLEAGCDEAGRGPLAGPVFAAAVILPDGFSHPLLNDSKQMTAKDRETLRTIIMENATAFAVEAVTAEEIDAINILNASIAGMWRAVMNLPVRPQAIAVDGNRFKPYGMIPQAGELSQESVMTAEAVRRHGPSGLPHRPAGMDRQHMKRPGSPCPDGPCPDWSCPGMDYADIPYRCIIKGDSLFTDIAAASVLAKTARDEYMKSLAEEYPQYGWERNMGYPTREHIEAIRRFGLTPHHRKSFHVRELEPVLF